MNATDIHQEKIMKTITTRAQFVEVRNSFFSALNELNRQLPHSARVAKLSSGGKNASNRASDLERHQDSIKEMTKDYDILREISAMPSPSQADFDRAESLAKKWNVFAFS